jgi:hypothetical protein
MPELAVILVVGERRGAHSTSAPMQENASLERRYELVPVKLYRYSTLNGER